MASVQLSFTLRTTPNAKTVHLVGTWDNYKGQLPLSKDKDSGKAGAWKGTFKFQGAAITQGQRYWYYYIIDGYHVSHDPARPSTTEPTTNRKLNILDVPKASKGGEATSSKSSRAEKRSSKHIPHGRALSPERISHPHPTRPSATKHFHSREGVAELTRRFAASGFSDDSGSDFEDSDNDSDCPSLSSQGSSACSSPEIASPGSFSPTATASSTSSRSSSTSSTCSCDRFGITRKGDRVRLDCGGKRCGGSDVDCSSEEEGSDPRGTRPVVRERDTRRHGIVVRHERRHTRA